jgi:hypothetical protein
MKKVLTYVSVNDNVEPAGVMRLLFITSKTKVLAFLSRLEQGVGKPQFEAIGHSGERPQTSSCLFQVLPNL